MKLPHVIESQQFTVPLLMELFERTRQMEKVVARGGAGPSSGFLLLASCFYSPHAKSLPNNVRPCLPAYGVEQPVAGGDDHLVSAVPKEP